MLPQAESGPYQSESQLMVVDDLLPDSVADEEEKSRSSPFAAHSAMKSSAMDLIDLPFTIERGAARAVGVGTEDICLMA